MVVISAAVLAKSGPLIARQFVEVTKIRIEGLLSAFLKLVDGGVNRDHTYIETDSVRYVYQPMENLYLLLITNKSSNILEDLDTLRLMQQCVQSSCHHTPVQKDHVLQKAFDIVFAFDEVISFGYRESLTLSQIRTCVEMESHEEKLQDMIRKSKEQEEASRRKQIASKLDKEHAMKRREEKERQRAAVAAEFDALTIPSIVSRPISADVPASLGAAAAAMGVAGSDAPYAAGSSVTTVPAGGAMMAPQTGMTLSKKPTDVLDALRATEQLAPSKYMPAPEPVPHIVNPLEEPVQIAIEEKVSAQVTSEGVVEELDVQGAMKVVVLDVASAGLANFRTVYGDKRFRVSLHPSMSKTPSAEGVLELADISKPFRANVQVPLVRWRSLKNAVKGEDALPVSLSCWPASTKDCVAMTMELEFSGKEHQALQGVKVQVPLPSGPACTVVSLSSGEWSNESNCLCWTLPVIDCDNPSATIEFSVRGEASDLFPLTFEAHCKKPVFNLEVSECYDQREKTAIKYKSQQICVYDVTVTGSC